MPIPLEGTLAPNIVCVGGYIIRVTALNATTGAVVSGVTVSGVSLQVDADEPVEESPPVALLPPLLVHEPQNTIGGAH